MSMKVTMAEFVGLESCPFCGKVPRVKYPDQDGGCTLLHICKFVFNPTFATQEEAIVAWNTRAERTCYSDNEPIRLYNDKYHVFRCSECHHQVNLCYNSKPNYCPNCGAKVVNHD